MQHIRIFSYSMLNKDTGDLYRGKGKGDGENCGGKPLSDFRSGRGGL